MKAEFRKSDDRVQKDHTVATVFLAFLQLTYDEKELLKLPNRAGLMKNYLLCTPANDKRTTAGTFIDEGGHE